MASKENGEKVANNNARQNWKKLSAVRKFLSLAQSTQKKAPAELIIGGKYKVGKKIANGAFGQLRLAKHTVTGTGVGADYFLAFDWTVAMNLLFCLICTWF